MRLCNGCLKRYGKSIKKILGVEVSECKFQECEFGHPTFKPELPYELANKTAEFKERTKDKGSSTWGWVYFYPSYGDVWYWWLSSGDTCDGIGSIICFPWRPSDETNCDIHYEPWIWIDDLQDWFGGLVNFGGCNPAINCGGDCGKVNSKREGTCLRRYNQAPEVFQDGWLWCLYDATGIPDCVRRTQYMVLDYIPP